MHRRDLLHDHQPEAPMQINHLTRAYRYDGMDRPVPPHLANDPTALRAYHATLYPAILNAETVDAGVSGAAHVIEYRRAVGTKG
jgi:PRTRC genetic system protein C